MKLLETFNQILESATTERDGLKILTDNGIDGSENIIKQMADGDNSNNQKNIPAMAFLYSKGNASLENIIKVMNEYNALEIDNRVKPIQLTKTEINIGNNKFKNFVEFANFVHGQQNLKDDNSSDYFISKTNVEANFKSEKKPFLTGDGIDVYEGDTIGNCIEYTQGGLTGKPYSFCIGGLGSNNLFKSYRDTSTSTFYFIVDKNHFKTNEDGTVNLDDPLHMVVFDRAIDGVKLTDANNTTGRIAEYGKDVNAYVEYLKSKGIQVEKMVNKPKTEQEKYEDKLLGQKNDSLEWFMKLPMKYKSAYIGRGHQLTNDQFDYLIGK